MTFGEAVRSCYSHYATFRGRASRSEYWFFVLFQCLITIACWILIPLGLGHMFLWLFALGNFLPALSVTVRRLHDIDHSG
jgi:uncharacterized membrane protein YhaH (DUF805 family)